MKKEYTQAELEICSFDRRDIIVTSPFTRDAEESPQMPVNNGPDPYNNN